MPRLPINGLFVLGGVISLIAAATAGAFLFAFSLSAIEDSIVAIGESQADSVSGRVSAAIEHMELQRNASRNFVELKGAASNSVADIQTSFNTSALNFFAAIMTTQGSISGLEMAILVPGGVPRINTTGYFKTLLYYDPLKDGSREYLYESTALSSGPAFTAWHSLAFSHKPLRLLIGPPTGADDSAFKFNYQQEIIAQPDVPLTGISNWVSSDGNVYWFIQSYEYFIIDSKWAVVTVYDVIDRWYDLILSSLSDSSMKDQAAPDTHIIILDPVTEVVVATSIASERERQRNCYDNFSHWYNLYGVERLEDSCLRRRARLNDNALIRELVSSTWDDSWRAVGVTVPTSSQKVKIQGTTYITVTKQLGNTNELRPMLIWARDEGAVLGPVRRTAIITISVCCSVIVLASIFLALVAILGLLRPLRVVSEGMERLTNLEEVASRGEGTSMLTEVNDLQNHFRHLTHAVNGFAKYVPREVVKDLMLGDEVASLGMKPKTISVMFLDIADFTGICERLSESNDLISGFLGKFFDRNTKILMRHGATIDKFIGDCIMCFWNAPLSIDRQAFRTICAGVDIMQQCRSLSTEFESQGLSLRVRLGAHSGNALVGNVGCEARLNYTALGDTVNIASRLEALGKHFHSTFIVSSCTLSAAVKQRDPHQYFAHRYLGKVQVKGKQKDLRLYDIVGVPEQRCGDGSGKTERREESDASSGPVSATPTCVHIYKNPMCVPDASAVPDNSAELLQPEILHTSVLLEKSLRNDGDAPNFSAEMVLELSERQSDPVVASPLDEETSTIFAARGDALYSASEGYAAVASRVEHWIDCRILEILSRCSNVARDIENGLPSPQIAITDLQLELKSILAEKSCNSSSEEVAKALLSDLSDQCAGSIGSSRNAFGAIVMDEK